LKALGLYIHIPWCIKKCPYCDFNSHALNADRAPEQNYIDALLQDLSENLKMLNNPSIVSSIFIGGGTPSLFSADAFNQLLTSLKDLIPFQENLEITLEANPGTFESHKFAEYRKIGINRLSIGIQSFNNSHLTTLGRVHSAEESVTAIEIAHKAGFENINLDLMFGLPKQTNQEMQVDIQTAIDLKPSHISFYQLTLEPNTYFHKFPPPLPAHDQIYIGQKECQQLLNKAGFLQYEISAYAKNKAYCQHNVNYWRFGDYLGIGAGAHGKLNISEQDGIIRTQKLKSPEAYLKKVSAKVDKVLSNDIPLEFLMNSLRLKAGFSIDFYQETTGLASSTLEPMLSELVDEGLLTKQDVFYACSEKGWDFLDEVLKRFI